MKLNEDNCHLFVGEYKHESIWAKNGDARIWESNKQKLFELYISFGGHVSNLYEKAGRKLFALARLSSYMTLTQKRVPMKSFIQAQFGYFLLVWMFHGRVLNRKINHLHECLLRIVYRVSTS